jgi:hypothetical protein
LKYLQAPRLTRLTTNDIKQPQTLAQVLHNMGFHDQCELRTLAEAWRNLYALVKPDLVQNSADLLPSLQ